MYSQLNTGTRSAAVNVAPHCGQKLRPVNGSLPRGSRQATTLIKLKSAAPNKNAMSASRACAASITGSPRCQSGAAAGPAAHGPLRRYDPTASRRPPFSGFLHKLKYTVTSDILQGNSTRKRDDIVTVRAPAAGARKQYIFLATSESLYYNKPIYVGELRRFLSRAGSGFA